MGIVSQHAAQYNYSWHDYSSIFLNVNPLTTIPYYERMDLFSNKGNIMNKREYKIFHVTKNDVLEFNVTWPCSKIEVRQHRIEVQYNANGYGTVVDHDFSHDEDGPEVLALIDDILFKRKA